MDALPGLRVLDLGLAVAGPSSCEVLALFGAEVIRIETRKKLDISRRSASLSPSDGRYIFRSFLPGELPPEDMPTDSVTSNQFHLNKLGITLDLKQPEALELAKGLVRISDVVEENFRAGVMDSLGLGYSALKEIKPDIIMLSSSNAGSSGPEVGYLGYASLFAALGGMGHLTGYSDGPATEIRMPTDMMSAMTAAFALAAALIHRQCTGEGQYVDFSSRESVSCLIGDSLVDYSMNHKNRSRNGNLDDTMAPHNCYRCQGEDRWVSIAVATEEEWMSLCNAMGNPEWAKAARFSSDYERWQNQDELDKLLESWTINHSQYEVTEILQQAGVAAVPSFSADVIFSDRHLEARGNFEVVDHPSLGAQLVVGPPWKLSATPAKISSPGPMLGQHNDYVFGELLGLPSKEISRLAENKVLR